MTTLHSKNTVEEVPQWAPTLIRVNDPAVTPQPNQTLRIRVEFPHLANPADLLNDDEFDAQIDDQKELHEHRKKLSEEGRVSWDDLNSNRG